MAPGSGTFRPAEIPTSDNWLLNRIDIMLAMKEYFGPFAELL